MSLEGTIRGQEQCELLRPRPLHARAYCTSSRLLEGVSHDRVDLLICCRHYTTRGNDWVLTMSDVTSVSWILEFCEKGPRA